MYTQNPISEFSKLMITEIAMNAWKMTQNLRITICIRS